MIESIIEKSASFLITIDYFSPLGNFLKNKHWSYSVVNVYALLITSA